MWEYIILFTLCFICGFLVGFYHDKLKLIEEVSRPIDKKSQPPQDPITTTTSPKKSGVIEYPSQEEVDYIQSGEAEVDRERERVFKEQFKV